MYHKYFGLSLAIVLLISALTGVFLAWKKDVSWIQPPTQNGVSKELQDWMPISELAELAQAAFDEAHPQLQGNGLDRIDVRPSKGIAKVLFEEGWWEVQIDGSTGEVLSIAKRHSDWIEKLHDGSIVGDLFKLITMNGLGLGLIVLMITGMWLWYGPKLYRKLKRKRG